MRRYLAAHRWPKAVLGGAIGAVALFALGKLQAFAAGSCSVLCDPTVALTFGGGVGAWAAWTASKPWAASPD